MVEMFSWHQKAWQHIECHRASKRFPHAFLLWGASGLAKNHFAKQLANDLLCQTGERACGQCQGCRWYQKNIHPDFILLEPLKGKKSIVVDQIRELQSDLALVNHQKTPRVIYIKDAEKMNIAASNALLKSLEEPNSQCVYLLVSNSLLTIPATIQSRCQTLYFPPATTQEVEAYLLAQGTAIEHVSLLHGSPLLSGSLLTEASLSERNEIINNLNDLLSGKKSPCSVASQWEKSEHIFTLRVLFESFSDLIKLSCGACQADLTHQSHLSQMQNMLKRMHKQKLFTILDKITVMIKYVLAARQINVALWFDDVAIAIITN